MKGGFESKPTNDTDCDESVEEMANADEHLADEEWLERCNEVNEEHNNLN